MHNFLKGLIIGFTFLSFLPAIAQDYNGYTFVEAKEIHEQFSYDSWLRGGDFSRYLFLNFPEFWPHAVVDRSGKVRALAYAIREEIANFLTKTELGEIKLKDYVQRPTVDGVIVLHKAQIVYEEYPNMFPYDKHIWFSTTKTIAATLIAILEDRNQIDVSMPVSTYLPEVEGTDWGRIAIIDILDMCSGMCYDDWELKCFGEFFSPSGWPGYETSKGSRTDRLREMGQLIPSAKIYQYSSINTTVLGWIVERITGLKATDLIEREIWQKMGAESDGLMFIHHGEEAFYAGGMNSTLRDLARFGLLFTPSGRQGPYNVISAEYLQKIQKGGRADILKATGPIEGQYIFDYPKTKEHLVDGESPSHATYQWDVVMNDGDFFKAGLGGQGLYISPNRDLVIAYFGTHAEGNVTNHLPRISRQLAKSGLFDE